MCCTIFVVIAAGHVVVLDHDRAAHPVVAAQAHTEPVLAHRSAGIGVNVDAEAGEDGHGRSDQRLAMAQQRGGHAVVVMMDGIFGTWIRVEVVAAVGEVEVAEGLAFGIVKNDVEVLCGHQPADDAMDFAQHLVHFQPRTAPSRRSACSAHCAISVRQASQLAPLSGGYSKATPTDRRTPSPASIVSRLQYALSPGPQT
jgi:hypothetical protein